jgi:glycosyltransferase involved in cell wall biosynthesis
MLTVHQINLQPLVGGGEVYTRFFSRALADAGARVRLYVRPGNDFWSGLNAPAVEPVPVADAQALRAALPGRGALILTQAPLPRDFLEWASREHILTGFAHMPMLDRSAEEFRLYRLVLTVSAYCVRLIRAKGIEQCYDEPLYGTFDIDRGQGARIVARSPYVWDRRKFRDRLLGWLEPAFDALRAHPVYAKPPGIVLGIVSLLSPIKQYPLLFRHLAPILAPRGEVRLEIFGNGGFAQVRDLRRSLAPLGSRVRFWGYQSAVQAIYPRLDYLMTGLPEKEALGLNALEAQACGTPVLAPDAPPFTETVAHGETGFLYRDPREDSGSDFAALLDSIVAGRPRPDPRRAVAHLEKFSYRALVDRVRRLVRELERRFSPAA